MLACCWYNFSRFEIKTTVKDNYQKEKIWSVKESMGVPCPPSEIHLLFYFHHFSSSALDPWACSIFFCAWLSDLMSQSLPSAAAIDKAMDKGAHEDRKFSISHITPEETERLLLSDGMWGNFPRAIGWLQLREFPEFERAASFWARCEGGRKIVTTIFGPRVTLNRSALCCLPSSFCSTLTSCFLVTGVTLEGKKWVHLYQEAILS